MKLVIIGGNSGTGAALAELARQASHEVTVVSRSGSRTAHGQINQLNGDASDPEFAVQAIAGADAVAITVGGSKGKKNARTSVTRSVTHAMQANGPQRLLIQSSLGAGNSGSQLPGVIGLISKMLLAKPLADHTEQEKLVEDSGLDWSIVRPTGLGSKPALGKWTALQVGEPGRLGGSITRDDLAAFMLETLQSNQSISKGYGVSN
ncbi:NAD(P)-dependent oxidoreductase [Micrococcus antarcticus]